MKGKTIDKDNYFETVNSPRGTIHTTKFTATFAMNPPCYELPFFPSYTALVLDLSDEPLTYRSWLEPANWQNASREVQTLANYGGRL